MAMDEAYYDAELALNILQELQAQVIILAYINQDGCTDNGIIANYAIGLTSKLDKLDYLIKHIMPNPPDEYFLS